ncbi:MULTISPECIES: DUF3158 family protein [Entomomonas]|uniref:DUF3158 family protein n=1 Tax=Entomomonas asaccharolytica TaxID=2785331 RepID=A0A974NHH0_9GAMM|nr:MULTISPECIES: DUF3158 family protein [Entomomonas]QQP86816.1 DUF3158 family protein [Entomomonas asaccharolytica]UYZ83566.1 DUF3158 family protein [Entomomonas sp. E2T0]
MQNSEQSAYKLAEQIVSSSAEQIASLKGLLKGKGEHEDSALLISHAKYLKPKIFRLMEELLVIVNQPPYTLFDLRMRIQNSAGDNSYLRWRNSDFTLMGVHIWENAMLNPPVRNEQSLKWLNDLAYFEIARLELNKHMSYLSILSKQHKEHLQNLDKVTMVLKKSTEQFKR